LPASLIAASEQTQLQKRCQLDRTRALELARRDPAIAVAHRRVRQQLELRNAVHPIELRAAWHRRFAECALVGCEVGPRLRSDALTMRSRGRVTDLRIVYAGARLMLR
jgi:hypothetical protein